MPDYNDAPTVTRLLRQRVANDPRQRIPVREYKMWCYEVTRGSLWPAENLWIAVQNYLEGRFIASLPLVFAGSVGRRHILAALDDSLDLWADPALYWARH